jgi:ABC-type multidrug transport system fused ATPase/permease subunit
MTEKPTNSPWDTVRQLFELLEPRDRRRAALVLGMILLMGVLETAGVASIMPFVALLANPNLVETNRYFIAVNDWLGFDHPHSLLLVLGFLVIGLAIGTTVFKALTSFAVLRFTAMRNYSLSQRLFKGYLYQPYPWFLRRNSSDLGKTILAEVGEVIGGALMPALQVIAQGTIALFLVALLVAIDPLLALTVTMVLGGIYGLVYLTTRGHLERIGAGRLTANKERYRASSEAFGGIKDVKILGLEPSFLQRFEKPSRRFVRYQIASQMIIQIPNFALQIMTVTGVMLIVLYQSYMSGGIGKALPVVAVYALAGYRLAPAIHKVYQSIATLRVAKPALRVVHRDLADTAPAIDHSEAADCEAIAPLSHQIELRDVTYSYPASSAEALSGVSLTIRARSTVGIVGRTGAGKTTVVDVILGLLSPQKGQLLVDDRLITTNNKRAWQRRLGYVPQYIFLIDDTVAANIAFGVAPSQVDLEAVERAARIANLHSFVAEELEQGYATLIGERGVRLSGGQRQRIGIARALYHDPDIIIMDEATSALDNITERAVIEAVNNLANRKTIVIIAHRLTTVRRCDDILLLEHGRVVAKGPYDELKGNSEQFREMVNATLS